MVNRLRSVYNREVRRARRSCPPLPGDEHACNGLCHVLHIDGLQAGGPSPMSGSTGSTRDSCATVRQRVRQARHDARADDDAPGNASWNKAFAASAAADVG